jgi:hypothetical protein
MMKRFAGMLARRAAHLIEHEVVTPVGQGVLAIALGLRRPERSRRTATRSDDGGAGRQAVPGGLRAGRRQVDVEPAGAELTRRRALRHCFESRSKRGASGLGSQQFTSFCNDADCTQQRHARRAAGHPFDLALRQPAPAPSPRMRALSFYDQAASRVAHRGTTSGPATTPRATDREPVLPIHERRS